MIVNSELSYGEKFALHAAVGVARSQAAGSSRGGGSSGAKVVGGTASELSGGKFANGALSNSFQYLFIEAATAAQKHFARNAENDQLFKDEGLYGRNDLTVDEIQNAGEFGFKQASPSESELHRLGPGNKGNLKFTSKVADSETWYQRNFSNRYGRYEIVVSPNGDGTFTHVTDSVNMGTLNRGNSPFTHVARDVVPYIRFGNTPD